jgi:glycolate oxidase
MNMKLIAELEKLLGCEGVLSRPEELLLYEYDGSVEQARPDCIVFPRDKQQVIDIVKLANRFEVPLVGRGAGTGLSGGALARRGGIVVAFTRMNHILEIDAANQRAVVEPGVVNLDLTRAAEKHGLYFAPDPSSQKACTIGGNVAENSGGPHTLAYGITANHVTGMEIVLPDGTVAHLGGKTVETPGYDLTGLFVGSEGTFALITEITVKLLRTPEEVRTLLAVYDTLDDATDSVAEFTARGVTPAP